MKITLFAVGTIVDVNLFLALALGLRNLGHRIVLVVPDRHKDYANQYETVVRSWKNPLHNEMIAICRDGDAMIIHPTLAFEAAVVSEKLRMPFMFAASVPYFPGVASFSSPRVNPVGLLSRLPDRWLAYRFNKRKTREMNDWRVRLGMQPFRSSCLKQLERQRFPVLHAYSPTLLPLPRESGEHHFISGVIGLPRSRHLAPVGLQPKLRDELMAWLDSGSPPVYFGASSLPPHMTAKGVDMIVELTQQLQARAIVPSRLFQGGAIGHRLSESIRLVDAADPLALFSRCSCVIHDGNADTTHAVIEAGKPAVICSVDWEQRLWGERIEEHRVGSHLARSKLTLPGLIKAIRKQLSDPAQKRAAELGVRLRSENGLQRGLEWVEQRLPIAPVYNND